MYIVQFALANILGLNTLAGGGFVRLCHPDSAGAPVVGLVKKERIPIGFDFSSFASVPPDLAVEDASLPDCPTDVDRKRTVYAEAEALKGWIDDRRQRVVTAHTIGEPADRFHFGEYLEVGSVLPGLSMLVENGIANSLDE